MTPQTPQGTSRWPQIGTRALKFLPLACFAFVFTYFIVSLIGHFRSKEGSSAVWTGLLFFIPLVVQFCALCFLFVRHANWYYYYFNLGVTTICFGSCFYFWHCYFLSTQEIGGLQGTSYETLYVILVLLICVGIMTYSIMRPNDDHLGGKFCNQLNSGVKDHPFWAVMFFLTLFFGVAYLFGFTLAFHDKYALTQKDKNDPDRHRPALHMINLKSIDDLTETTQREGPASGENINAQAAPSPSTQNQTVTVSQGRVDSFSFYFNSGEASLGREDLPACKEDAPPKRQWDRDSSELRANERFNDCNLRAIVKRIKDATGEGQRVRVTLIGHGDSDPVSRSPIYLNSKSLPLLHYLSNYELSEARAENVKYEILQMFPDTEKWHNIEWLILPASNEDTKEIREGLINQKLFEVSELGGKFTQDEIARGISPERLEILGKSELVTKLYAKLSPKRLAEESRVVLASTKSVPDHIASLEMKQISQTRDPRPLGLMDYMYFSIYTITTTGYGDIVPTTAFGKFVTSLENFCEVLFLVVFFNVLISLKRDPPDRDSTQDGSSLSGGFVNKDEVAADNGILQ